MEKALLGIILIFFISCNEKYDAKFSLTGKTKGIENGTMIYLDNADSQNIDLIDSTLVENNSFVFKTKLSNSPLQVVLWTIDDSHYRFLWLENNAMTFDASQNNFENATVTGSDEEILGQSLRKELENLSEENQRKKEIEFIKKHPNSIVSAETLSAYCTTYGKKITKKLFDQLSEKNKSSKYGKIISIYMEYDEAKIGGKFIDFEMADQNGKLLKLSELKGKTILLDFWASWCINCQKENSNLVKIHKKFKSRGFEIFAVSLDENKDKWINAIEKDNLNWYHVNDLKGQGNKATLIYGVEGIPDSFLIDENGIIIGRDLRGKELNEKLSELLN
jgi:peroxiredoxin